MGLGKAATAYVDGGVPGNKDFNTFQELEVWKVKKWCFPLLFFPGISSFFFAILLFGNCIDFLLQ